MVIEMRTYRTKPGMRGEVVRLFRERCMPVHEEIGMRILGPFLCIDEPDGFFFMRGFPDAGSRKTMKERFYEGPLWKAGLGDAIMAMLEKYDVALVDDPDCLVKWTP